MCPPLPSDNDPEPGLPPGADRFWGQMSQARAGRTGAEEPAPEPEQQEPEDADTGGGQAHECLEWCPICRSHELLKGATSPEIRQQLQAIQNEAMNVFKAFAAAYSDRAASEDPFSRGRHERPPYRPDEPDEPVVTDISID